MDSKHVIGLYEAYQSVYEEEGYSPKKARKGEDIGKPGKMFKKIEREAAKRYGSEESGKRVAGAVLAKLRREEVDLYDVVLEHLLDEGYCDDVDSAEIIMANMSEQWRDEILEALRSDVSYAREAVSNARKRHKQHPEGHKGDDTAHEYKLAKKAFKSVVDRARQKT